MTVLEQTVLFVDDEQALLDGLRNALRKEPYDILTANSAQEGLRVLHEGRIDVVVSDERMPGVSGSDFLAYVRQRYPETVRIMLTGQASLDATIQAINEGEIYRFLTKPCSPVQLAQTLRSAFLLRNLTREAARLLATVRRQRRLLQELERRHPGITSVEPDTGASASGSEGPLAAADLVREMRGESARGAATPIEPPSGGRSSSE
jgi:two-component system, probable response regulator PhcQ